MALSPNYGWAEPDNSSLVKNGAQDIRALGDAIDTSVWNVGFGQAGKNKIINGDFRINQRNFTSTTTSGTYGFDRFFANAVDGTTTYSAQTFTPGTAPVAGYEGVNFARIASTGQTLASAQSNLRQHIENARTFAGQTVTVSFWAKAATATPNVAIELQQYFGSGGSPSTTVSYNLGKVTLSTSWQRFSASIALSSLSGVTFGTNNDSSLLLILWTSAGSNFNSRTGTLGIQTATIDFWGVQVEYGSKATPFQTASGGSLQGELAMCQRYYWRKKSNATYAYVWVGQGTTRSTTRTILGVDFPVNMRSAPTINTSGTFLVAAGTGNVTVTGFSINQIWEGGEGGYRGMAVNADVASGLTAGYATFCYANNDANAFAEWSAEL